MAHRLDYTTQFYVVDSHGFGTAVQSKDFEIEDVPPVYSAYSTEDISLTVASDGDASVILNVQLSDDNGYNDIEMINWAGLGVAVGESVPELLAVADRRAGSVADDGAACILEELLNDGLIARKH